MVSMKGEVDGATWVMEELEDERAEQRVVEWL